MKTPVQYTYIDLFAGCGGLSLGLSKAGWKGVFAIEKNKDAFMTLSHNLIERKNHFDWPDWLPRTKHDINTVLRYYREELESLKGTVDLVTGGPPCQGFSSAGKRRENDKRNTLIKSYLKFISIVQPKIIFFENVKGFTTKFNKNKSKGIAYSDYVVKRLTSLGYSVKGEMVDFSKFGLPQKRTRFILVGIKAELFEKHKEGSAGDFFSLIKQHRQAFLAAKGLTTKTTLGQAISDLLFEHGTVPSPDTKKFNAGIYVNSKTSYQDLMRIDNVNLIPDSHRFVNHKESTVNKFRHIIHSSTAKNKTVNSDIRKKFKINKHTVIPLDSSKPSPTLTTLPDDYIHYKEPRILTVREYARLQSFPDSYEFKGKYTTGGKVRTMEVPRYTQIGNAIPPIFGEQCGNTLKLLIS